MLEKLLPTHPFRWFCFEHLSNQILAHLGNGVYLFRKNDFLLHNDIFQLNNILGIEWRSSII